MVRGRATQGPGRAAAPPDSRACPRAGTVRRPDRRPLRGNPAGDLPAPDRPQSGRPGRRAARRHPADVSCQPGRADRAQTVHRPLLGHRPGPAQDRSGGRGGGPRPAATSSRTRRMTITGDQIEHEIHIQAPPEAVFGFFTDSAMHDRWLGQRATLDPRRGGIYRCVMNDTATVAGEYLEVDPPHRVVFTWGFENNPQIPPGSSTVSITLTADHRGTRVRLVHTGLPHPAIAPHHQGWAGYLAQLADAAARS